MKGSSKPYYQEALCEVIASRIAGRLGINHVEYSVIWENEEPLVFVRILLRGILN